MDPMFFLQHVKKTTKNTHSELSQSVNQGCCVQIKQLRGDKKIIVWSINIIFVYAKRAVSSRLWIHIEKLQHTHSPFSSKRSIARTRWH